MNAMNGASAAVETPAPKIEDLLEAKVKAVIMAEMVQRYCEHTAAARELPQVHQVAKAATDAVAGLATLLTLMLQIASAQALQAAASGEPQQDKEAAPATPPKKAPPAAN